MPTYNRACAALAVIMIVHVLALTFGWYMHWTWFDIPMHFAGGCGIGYLVLAGWRANIRNVAFLPAVTPFRQTLICALAVVGVVMIVGVAWEWYEFLFDQINVALSAGLQPAQMGLGDTMADLGLDFLGALTLFIVLRKQLSK